MKNQSVRRGAFAALALFLEVGLAPPVAEAVPVQLALEGVVTFVENGIVDARFDPGMMMSATIVYDSDSVPDVSLFPTQLLYQDAVIGGSYDVDGYAAGINGGNINVADDDSALADQIVWRTGGMGAPLAPGSLFALGLGIDLSDPTGNALSTKALPITDADVAGLTDRSWFLSFGSAIPPATAPGVGGRLTHLELTVLQVVPAPSALQLLMVVLPLLGVAAGHRLRRLA